MAGVAPPCPFLHRERYFWHHFGTTPTNVSITQKDHKGRLYLMQNVLELSYKYISRGEKNCQFAFYSTQRHSFLRNDITISLSVSIGQISFLTFPLARSMFVRSRLVVLDEQRAISKINRRAFESEKTLAPIFVRNSRHIFDYAWIL